MSSAEIFLNVQPFLFVKNLTFLIQLINKIMLHLNRKLRNQQSEMKIVKQQLLVVQNKLRVTESLDKFQGMTDVTKREEYRQRGLNTMALYVLKDSMTKYLDKWLSLSEDAEEKLNSTEEKLNSTKEKLNSTKETLQKYEQSVLNSYRCFMELVEILEEASQIKNTDNCPKLSQCAQSFKSIWIIVDRQIDEIVQLVETAHD